MTGTLDAIARKFKKGIMHYKKYLEIMQFAREPQFKVLKDPSIIKDFKNALASIFKTNKPVSLAPKKQAFMIQKYVRIKYFPNGEVHVSPTYNASYSKFVYRHSNIFVYLKPVEEGLKQDKTNDLKALLPFIKASHRS